MHEGLLLLLISVLRCADGSFLRQELTGPSMAFSKSTASASLPVHLEVVIPVQGVSLIPDPNPPVIYEGVGFNLSCKARKGTHLNYSWYHNMQEVTSPSPHHHFVGNMLTVDRADERHAGSYLCMAKNVMRNITRVSSSMVVTVVVKKYLSDPRLSFTVYHDGSGYYANISCRLAYGSPPVTFQLLLNGKRVDVQQVDLLEAWFSQPVTIGLDMGSVQCIAENDIQQLLSNSVNLEVAPVTGTAHVQVEYLHRLDSVQTAALLQCVITTGTFPFFLWSFNSSTIPLDSNSLTFIQRDQFLVLTHINPENLGYYSCRARDSFNSNSSWVESEDVLVEMSDLEATPIEVIAVVFCCFLFVMIVGGACCLLRSINLERVPTDTNHRVHSHEHISPENHHTKPETRNHPYVEEMETLFMDTEV
ncbi:cell adhesion molecule-related/down-regulated by oncogenes isoform X2 [Tachysurus fulvidraco]|uniref:cell adhesion molecule-related/down-regulated by oncogenes isoform X2 n=1 Tax=Tachysurus fulvidraco TaxID=1234273 RepID=UPI000F4DCE6B|nr:cell adhesion molecule-related/down-regulated by oncogenes isoform X2 [Tachysurus fulvidraco]